MDVPTNTALAGSSLVIKVDVAVGSLSTPDLLAVCALWKANSQTLGFFPDTALVQHSKKGWLLVAKDDTNSVVGYLLYRLARGRAVIVHLCSDARVRGKGVARTLFEVFRQRTSEASAAV